ncbi:MAG: Ldh family oxidoreductase [Granulosicoccus sp.]|nr:Ldh family oxidoreductase [Granulosicoccus sp.]
MRDGKPNPEGWAVDSQGHPTTDPAAALEGAQLPFGGHKGSSLALMVELLAGALLGDLFSFESSDHDKHKVGAPFGGELVIAIDPKHFVRHSTQTSESGETKTQTQRAELLFEKILDQDGTRLPSSRRHKAREASSVSGIHVATSLVKTLQTFAGI